MQHTMTKSILNTETILSILIELNSIYYASIMLDALGTYYAQNYAGIIGWFLHESVISINKT